MTGDFEEDCMAGETHSPLYPILQTLMLDIAKSAFLGFAVKSLTGKAEARDDGMNLVFEGVCADGTVLHEQFAAKFDGKDYPFSVNPFADTISLRRINGSTLEYVQKKDGKEVAVGRVASSEDGKTSTETIKMRNSQGEDLAMTLVYDLEATDPFVGIWNVNLSKAHVASTETISSQRELVERVAPENGSKLAGDFVEVW